MTAIQLHIILPCSRPQNIGRLADLYLQQMEPHPFAVRLHILKDGATENDPWGLGKINEALGMIQDGWVWIVDDDTTHDVPVLRRLGEVVQSNPHAAVVVFSQHHVFGHILHAAPENVKLGKIDMAQMFWRRSFLGDERFALQGEADGWMAEKMFAKDPARWVFYDEVLIHKNNLK